MGSEFAIIAIVLVLGFVLHRAFGDSKPALERALERLEQGQPVRAEYIVEQARKAARPGTAAAGMAGFDLGRVLVKVGDISRARAVLDEAIELLEARGAAGPAAEAQTLRESLGEPVPKGEGAPLDTAGAPDAEAWRLAVAPMAVDVDLLNKPEPPPPEAVRDRCDPVGGCGSCGPAGVVDAEGSRAFAQMLAGGRAAKLVKGVEIRREGERVVPRVTVAGVLSEEEEQILDRAVSGAMAALYG